LAGFKGRRHPVPAIDGHFESGALAPDAEDMLHVAGGDVEGPDLTTARARAVERAGDPFDVLEPARLAHRDGVLPAHLEAVVTSGVVGGGDHDTPAQLLIVDREIQHRGRDQSEIGHRGALLHEPPDQGVP
jgi:hypothetical protein